MFSFQPDDSFPDKRPNYNTNEITTYINAKAVMVLARLYGGSAPIGPPPPPSPPLPPSPPSPPNPPPSPPSPPPSPPPPPFICKISHKMAEI